MNSVHQIKPTNASARPAPQYICIVCGERETHGYVTREGNDCRALTPSLSTCGGYLEARK